MKFGLLLSGVLLSGAGSILYASASSGPETSAQCEPHSSIQANLGFQLFAVRNPLKDDFKGTLTTLAEIGYTEVEMFGFGRSIFIEDPLWGYHPGELKQLLEDLYLRIHSTAFSGPGDDLAKIADTAKELGFSYLVQEMATEFLTVTPDGPVVSGVTGADQVKLMVDRLNAFGETCKKSGIGFAYHNHHMEFVPIGDRLAFDILLEETDPELMRLVTPGDGTVDFAAVMAAMDRADVEHAYVEVDMPGDTLEVVRRGFRHLRSLTHSVDSYDRTQ